MESLRKIINFYKENNLDEIIFEETYSHISKDNIISSSQENLNTAVVRSNDIISQQNFTKDKSVNTSNEGVYKSLKDIDSLDKLFELIKSSSDFDKHSSLSPNPLFFEQNKSLDILVVNLHSSDEAHNSGEILIRENKELLNNMMKAIDMSDSYGIINSFFWKMPPYVNPKNTDLSLCLPYLERAISLLNPKILICLGGNACKNLTNTSKQLTELIGCFMNYKNCFMKKEIPLLTIYHPTFLLKQVDKKKDTWESLKKVKKICENSL